MGEQGAGHDGLQSGHRVHPRLTPFPLSRTEHGVTARSRGRQGQHGLFHIITQCSSTVQREKCFVTITHKSV